MHFFDDQVTSRVDALFTGHSTLVTVPCIDEGGIKFQSTMPNPALPCNIKWMQSRAGKKYESVLGHG